MCCTLIKLIRNAQNQKKNFQTIKQSAFYWYNICRAKYNKGITEKCSLLNFSISVPHKCRV